MTTKPGAIHASLATFDGAQIALADLRKGLKLRRRAEELIGQAIERAKPGLIGMLFLSSDSCSDAWEREHSDNANRLRSKLLELRGPIVEMIREELGAVIQTGRLAYIEMLEGLPATLLRRKTVWKQPARMLHGHDIGFRWCCRSASIQQISQYQPETRKPLS